ncbi:hypothetical protein IWX50DRAFT_275215 [Phyllosticta citricarpa]
MPYQTYGGIELEETSKAWRRFSTASSATLVKTYASDTRRFMLDLGPKVRRVWKSSPGIKNIATDPLVIRHVTAFLLLLLFGFAPIFFYFRFVHTPFKTLPVSCGDYKEEDDDSTSGIQGLFMIDRTTGAFEFWVVKLIDIIWDLFVGRGLQWLAGWISYVVFSSALLRAIEASPIPYRTFIRLSLGTPSVYTIWSLLADLRRYSRKCTILLFSYAALASAYVLAMPTLFGAMTGYLSTSISYTQLRGSEGQFVPTDSMYSGYVANGLADFSNKTCISSTDDVMRKMKARLYGCPAKTCTDGQKQRCLYVGLPEDCSISDSSPYYGSYHGSYYDTAAKEECGFDDETMETYYSVGKTYNCSDETGFVLDGHNYTFWEIYNATAESRKEAGMANLYCYGTTPYYLAGGLEAASQCLPNTNNPGYQWGFSALLSSIILIAQVIWGCSMYIVWVEAQANSRLLRSGYCLTELRGAFAFAAAAEATTGMESAELKGSSVKSLEKLLFDEKAAVEFSLFSTEFPSSEMAPLAQQGGNDRSSSPLPPPPAYTRLAENSNSSC